MNIPMFTREEFEIFMSIKGLPTSDFIYNDYRSFVVNKYCPVKRSCSFAVAQPDVQKVCELNNSVSYPEVVNGRLGITTETETIEVFKMAA